MYNELHCPFCGSTDICSWKEGFNHRAAFWGMFFMHLFGGIFFGLLCRKRTICECQDCGSRFSYYNEEVA